MSLFSFSVSCVESLLSFSVSGVVSLSSFPVSGVVSILRFPVSGVVPLLSFSVSGVVPLLSFSVSGVVPLLSLSISGIVSSPFITVIVNMSFGFESVVVRLCECVPVVVVVPSVRSDTVCFPLPSVNGDGIRVTFIESTLSLCVALRTRPVVVVIPLDVSPEVTSCACALTPEFGICREGTGWKAASCTSGAPVVKKTQGYVILLTKTLIVTTIWHHLIDNHIRFFT